MQRCDPSEMKKNLLVTESLMNAGIDFVPIPVKSEEHKKALIALMAETLDELQARAE